MQIALKEYFALERSRIRSLAVAMRMARWADDDTFREFVGEDEPVKPISDTEIERLFG